MRALAIVLLVVLLATGLLALGLLVHVLRLDAQTETFLSSTTEVRFSPVAFSTLGGLSPPNGTMMICSDCVTGACAGAGSGAVAVRLGGSWLCK